MKVIAVVVSYNRAGLLQDCLSAIAAQQRAADTVIVVDNASTDGAADVARRHPSAPTVVALARNIGGAGGFAVGLDQALAAGADYAWLMDDDTIPTPTALGQLLDTAAAYRGTVDLLGSRAVWTDGTDHPMNTPRPKWRASRAELAAAEAVGAMAIRTSSFVSMLVSADAVRRVGLPCADMFIWNDDFEFSARVLRCGRGLYVASSIVEHRTARLASTDTDPGERFYYEVRNKVWTFRLSKAFGWLDWLTYTGSTARRWVRTLRRSSDRPTLWRVGRRGWHDGFATRPRPAEDVVKQALAAVAHE